MTTVKEILLELINMDSTDTVKVVGAAVRLVYATQEACAKIAENVKDGYTSNVRISEDEQEFLKDPDGPWVLNSDVAKAIRAGKL
jgi:hypothetical protein